MINRRRVVGMAIGAAIVGPVTSHADEPRPPVVGVLVIPDSQLSTFRQTLQDLGHIERRTIRLEVRSAKGDLQRLPELATELVRAKADVIVAVFTPAVLAARQATSDIPIVMLGVGDPVGMGIVQPRSPGRQYHRNGRSCAARSGQKP
jgi:putative ABC transport system substrate-binding protein